MAALALLLAVGAPSQLPPYRIIDLGALPGSSSSYALGISNDGRLVVGKGSINPSKPFLWQSTSGMQALPFPSGYTRVFVRDVNMRGDVIGEAGWEVIGKPPLRAVHWDPAGHPELLPMPPGATYARGWGLNERGDFAGMVDVAPLTTKWHAFLWFAGGGYLDLTPTAPNSAVCDAHDINDRGQAVGNRTTTAFLYDSATGIRFIAPPPGFAHVHVAGLNSIGQIAATVIRADGSFERLARFTPGRGWELLSGLARDVNAEGIDVFGQVIGEVKGLGQDELLFTDLLGLRPLAPLAAGGGWAVSEAFDIADTGHICGRADRQSIQHAALLEPQLIRQYGAGCAGSGSLVLRFGGSGWPKSGQDIVLMLAQAVPGATALLVLSFSQAAMALPGGCTIYVGSPFTAAVPITVGATGQAYLRVPVPPGSGAAFLQAFSLDPSAPNGVFTASNGLRIDVQ